MKRESGKFELISFENWGKRVQENISRHILGTCWDNVLVIFTIMFHFEISITFFTRKSCNNAGIVYCLIEKTTLVQCLSDVVLLDQSSLTKNC